MNKPTLVNLLDELRQTQEAFLAILNQANEEALYHRPAPDSWTLAEALVHIAEARRFFADETRKILAAPGAEVGRTVEDPHRLQNIEDHGRDTLADIHQAMIASHEVVMQALSGISDDDLQLKAEHVRLGPQTLAEVIQRFLVGHDRMHVEQATALLAGEARSE
ncbi:MAG TPA: DinB family protein [Anaerolineae bacterium]|jgi:uncharacterized damage-inducible protein DinB